MQHEITAAGPLLRQDGSLCERGYSKRMLLQYDRTAIKAGRMRIKEWDYYLVYNNRFGVALTVADNSYMGLHGASLLDFERPWEQTTSIMTFMPNGKTALPAQSRAGHTAYKNSKIDISFDVGGGQRKLFCHLNDFKDGKPFLCELTLDDPDDESMVIATPYREKKTAFYYNQKKNCMAARGRAEFDGRVYEFDPADSFGILDWGRGVWTYNNTWYWGGASGTVNGERFGFNIGYGFGDTSAASENMLFYRGKSHKLEDVQFNIPQRADGSNDYLKAWTFSSGDGRFEMNFTPVLDRASKTSVVVIESDQHQVFGRYSGTAVLDDGTKIEIKDFMGFAEKVKNKW